MRPAAADRICRAVAVCQYYRKFAPLRASGQNTEKTAEQSGVFLQIVTNCFSTENAILYICKRYLPLSVNLRHKICAIFCFAFISTTCKIYSVIYHICKNRYRAFTQTTVCLHLRAGMPGPCRARHIIKGVMMEQLSRSEEQVMAALWACSRAATRREIAHTCRPNAAGQTLRCSISCCGSRKRTSSAPKSRATKICTRRWCAA